MAAALYFDAPMIVPEIFSIWFGQCAEGCWGAAKRTAMLASDLTKEACLCGSFVTACSTLTRQHKRCGGARFVLLAILGPCEAYKNKAEGEKGKERLLLRLWLDVVVYCIVHDQFSVRLPLKVFISNCYGPIHAQGSYGCLLCRDTHTCQQQRRC